MNYSVLVELNSVSACSHHQRDKIKLQLVMTIEPNGPFSDFGPICLSKNLYVDTLALCDAQMLCHQMKNAMVFIPSQNGNFDRKY